MVARSPLAEELERKGNVVDRIIFNQAGRFEQVAVAVN